VRSARCGHGAQRGPLPRFVLRDARTTDLEALLRLSRILDSINLPTNREDLRRVIAGSRRSFAARLGHPAEGVYVFVAEDRRSGRPVGSSMIIAKHGTPESPHYFLEMVNDERYSKTLRKMFRHTSLHLRHSMDGPTEVGGLVVDPHLRHHPERLGTQLSFVRFLYIAVHRECFAGDVIAEMKPPLTTKGTNRFWQCYGARVTGLTLREADRLSTQDKEFIPALFPNVPIYTCMLPLEVQEEIGTVAPETIGAVRLLERIGLRFLGQVDPFDAGPYYGAQTDAVSVVRDARRVCLRPESEARDAARREPYLVAVDRRGFLAFRAAARRVEDVLFVESAILSTLGLRSETPAVVVPVP
jgi:arginine N-succinyltransferase